MTTRPATAENAGRAVGDFFGLPALQRADLGEIAAALAIALAVALAAGLLARMLRRWFEKVIEPKLGLAELKVAIAGNHLAVAIAAVAAIAVLNMAAAAHGWSVYPELVFDLAIPFGAAVAARRLALAFNVPPSAALAIAIVCGFAVLSSRFEQLQWVERSLDSFAVTLGESRISLLGLIRVTFAGVVVYALARVAHRVATLFIRRRTNLDITQSLLAEKVAAVAIVVVAIFAAIDMLGIDTTALSIFSGTIGLGLGFGLQKIFSNLVSGIILLMDRSIKPGDVIVVGEAVGEVNRIGTRAVSVITRDGKEYLIPNEILMTERVENWNFSSRDIRIRMSLRVGYDTDIDLVETLLRDATRESPRVLDKPPTAVRITDISNSGVKLELRFWIRDPEDGLGNIQSEIYKRILAKFREHGIALPNEGRDIEILKVPPITFRRKDEG